MIQSTLVLLFDNNGNILLNMKKRGFGEGKYNGAGGKINPGETIIDGAIRELYEETNISLNNDTLISRGVLHFYFDANPNRNQDVHLFTGTYTGEFSETEEMKPEWFSINNIPYESMWEDDLIWLPRIISGEKNVEYDFVFGGDGKIKSYKQII